ncbi:hypothetical protein QQF64_034302 [Cirrhinus molitorella]|uniref:Uncharacterized protein n=1 Tax=Cirrhinus molitorella TaxID=172907 RepID=A0ABR3L270_9TELE
MKLSLLPSVNQPHSPNGVSNCSLPLLDIVLLRTDQPSVKPTINSGQVSLQAGEHSGAGDREGSKECMLSIVPVKVKHCKGSKVISTYAFLDPSSSATFYTKSLANKLNLIGRKTNILLQTMSQEKSVSSDVITGLEVSAIDQTFICY